MIQQKNIWEQKNATQPRTRLIKTTWLLLDILQYHKSVFSAGIWASCVSIIPYKLRVVNAKKKPAECLQQEWCTLENPSCLEFCLSLVRRFQRLIHIHLNNRKKKKEAANLPARGKVTCWSQLSEGLTLATSLRLSMPTCFAAPASSASCLPGCVFCSPSATSCRFEKDESSYSWSYWSSLSWVASFSLSPNTTCSKDSNNRRERKSKREKVVGLRFFPAAWSFKISVQKQEENCPKQLTGFVNVWESNTCILEPCAVALSEWSSGEALSAKWSCNSGYTPLVHFIPIFVKFPTTFHQRFDLWLLLTCLLVSGSLLTYQDFALNQTLCFRNCSQFSGHVSFCSEEDCGASKCIAYHLPNDLRMNQKLPHLDIGTGDPWCHSQ